MPPAVNIDEASQFIQTINEGIAKNKCFYWAISLKDNPRLIGTICYWNLDREKQCAEIGYELDPGFQGKGIMQEAIERVLAFGFQNMHLEKVMAFSHYDNTNSNKLLLKNNFSRHENIETEILPEPDNYVIYTLMKPTK